MNKPIPIQENHFKNYLLSIGQQNIEQSNYFKKTLFFILDNHENPKNIANEINEYIVFYNYKHSTALIPLLGLINKYVTDINIKNEIIEKFLPLGLDLTLLDYNITHEYENILTDNNIQDIINKLNNGNNIQDTIDLLNKNKDGLSQYSYSTQNSFLTSGRMPIKYLTYFKNSYLLNEVNSTDCITNSFYNEEFDFLNIISERLNIDLCSYKKDNEFLLSYVNTQPKLEFLLYKHKFFEKATKEQHDLLLNKLINNTDVNLIIIFLQTLKKHNEKLFLKSINEWAFLACQKNTSITELNKVFKTFNDLNIKTFYNSNGDNLAYFSLKNNYYSKFSLLYDNNNFKNKNNETYLSEIFNIAFTNSNIKYEPTFNAITDKVIKNSDKTHTLLALKKFIEKITISQNDKIKYYHTIPKYRKVIENHFNHTFPTITTNYKKLQNNNNNIEYYDLILDILSTNNIQLDIQNIEFQEKNIITTLKKLKELDNRNLLSNPLIIKTLEHNLLNMINYNTTESFQYATNKNHICEYIMDNEYLFEHIILNKNNIKIFQEYKIYDTLFKFQETIKLNKQIDTINITSTKRNKI